ncbi:glycosyltransferase family 2 protein [Myroides sp. LJL119]
MDAITLLVCTKNEAHNIAACINSAKDIVKQIIVVDSYSSDNTPEIAKQMGAQVLFRKFDDFSRQKNWALSQVKTKWVLLLDADEKLTPELTQEIQQIIQQGKLDNYNAYWFFRDNHFFNKPIRFGGYQNDSVIRLFKPKDCHYVNMVHENMLVNGTTHVLKNKLYHNTYTSFDRHISKLNRYAELQAQDFNTKTTQEIGIYHLILKPGFRFFKHYVIRQGFRDGTPGIILAFLGSYATFTRYAKLWMLRNNIPK